MAPYIHVFECLAIGCWRKYVTVETGFEVLYTQAMLSVRHNLLLLNLDQDVELEDPSPGPCLPTCCCASHDNNELNL